MTSRTSGSCSGRIFERAGHEVSHAADGAAALASVRDSPPDRVVTDLMMPVLDGAELIRHLRCEPATAGIPILAASADIHLAGALNVARMRNSRHEMTMKHLQITDTGITIGAKLEGVTGRLGWSALRTQDPSYHVSAAAPTPG